MPLGGKREGAGRPRAADTVLDMGEVYKLAQLLCTSEDIAGWFGVSSKTINRMRQSDELFEYEVPHPVTGEILTRTGTFSDVIEQGQAVARASLRRDLRSQAKTKPAAAIFLAKNLLGMKDIPDAPAGDGAAKVQYGWVAKSSDQSNTTHSPVSSDSTNAAIGSRDTRVQ